MLAPRLIAGDGPGEPIDPGLGPGLRPASRLFPPNDLVTAIAQALLDKILIDRTRVSRTHDASHQTGRGSRGGSRGGILARIPFHRPPGGTGCTPHCCAAGRASGHLTALIVRGARLISQLQTLGDLSLRDLLSHERIMLIRIEHRTVGGAAVEHEHHG